MDLGFPYTENEIKENTIRCKKYKRHLLEMKEVPDMKHIRNSTLVTNKETVTPVLLPTLDTTKRLYKIERIFKDHCKIVQRKGKAHAKYFVKWVGYSSCTWQYKSVLIKDLGKCMFNELLF